MCPMVIERWLPVKNKISKCVQQFFKLVNVEDSYLDLIDVILIIYNYITIASDW